MRFRGTYIGCVAMAALALALGELPAAWGKLQPMPAAQSQPDSSQKQSGQEKPEQEKPAQNAQEKPAQDQPAPSKPAQTPETQQAPADKQNPSEAAPSTPPSPAPGTQEGAPTPPASQEIMPSTPAPSPATPEAQPSSPGVETPNSSAPNTKPVPSANGSPRRNGSELNPRRKLIVREGGTADANAMLAPSMTPEQASRQRENTLHLLASADANLNKISKRQLNTNQQAMVDQARAYMQQSKEALNRGDLQRSHNLALKASLLTDDLARH